MGGIWGAGVVRGILTNCNYIGNVRYAVNDPARNFETAGKHEAIITEDLYNAAQILIKKNARTAPTKKPDERNYFVNLLYCDCGEKLYSHCTMYKTKESSKVKNFSYQCRKRYVSGGCDSKTVNAGKLEKALIDYFSRIDKVFTSDSEEAARIEQEKQKADTQIQSYREKLRQFDNREKEVMSHYLNGDIDFESYRNMKKQLDGDRAFINTELAKLTDNEGENPETISREEIAASFTENWEGLTNAEKRLFLTNYIKKIVVRNNPVEGSRFGDTKVLHVEFNKF